MKLVQPVVVYVLWLREMKHMVRAKSRIVGTLIMPLFLMAFLELGFGRTSLPGVPSELHYSSFLVPGIIAMSVLFTSTLAGISVLWDREFGFLKEIMVAPVSRLSIVLGRIAGGITTSLIQGIIILAIALAGGIPLSWNMLPAALLLLILMAVTFVSLGLIFAANMRDLQGFNLVMGFVVFPLFFLSGALFPLQNFPPWIRSLSYLDPLTYGVDGLRAALVGRSSFSIPFSLLVLAVSAGGMLLLGAYFFEKQESV